MQQRCTRGGYNHGCRSVSGYSDRQGIQQLSGTGINFNRPLGKRLKLSLDYFYGHVKSQSERTGLSRQFLSDTTIADSFANSSIYGTGNHQESLNVNRVVDSTASLYVRSNGNFGFDNGDGFNRSLTIKTFKGAVIKTDNHRFNKDDNTYSSHSLNFFKWSA